MKNHVFAGNSFSISYIRHSFDNVDIEDVFITGIFFFPLKRTTRLLYGKDMKAFKREPGKISCQAIMDDGDRTVWL